MVNHSVEYTEGTAQRASSPQQREACAVLEKYIHINQRYKCIFPHCGICLTRSAVISSVRPTAKRCAVADDPHDEALKALEDRIAAVKRANAPPRRADEHYSMANSAWRMVIGLGAGLGIGFGIGYALDLLFGSVPWFMLLFTGLGLVAGVKTMMRTAKELQDEAMRAAGKDPVEDEKRG